MKLFHGSTLAIEQPIILNSQRLLDFGNGFYTTSSKTQAENWALIKQKRIGENIKAIVSVYKITDDLINIKDLTIKVFDKATVEWLDFIVANRNGTITHSYDIVKGVVANDTLYATILLYENGVLSKKETIVRLKTHRLFDQISFHNQRALQELEFVESYEVK